MLFLGTMLSILIALKESSEISALNTSDSGIL